VLHTQPGISVAGQRTQKQVGDHSQARHHETIENVAAVGNDLENLGIMGQGQVGRQPVGREDLRIVLQGSQQRPDERQGHEDPHRAQQEIEDRFAQHAPRSEFAGHEATSGLKRIFRKENTRMIRKSTKAMAEA